MKIRDFAQLVQLSESCIRNWYALYGNPIPREKPAKGFQEIQVDLSRNSCLEIDGGVTIEGPLGLKITGLKTHEIVALWRQLC
jgi:hypothetical protein